MGKRSENRHRRMGTVEGLGERRVGMGQNRRDERKGRNRRSYTEKRYIHIRRSKRHESGDETVR